MLTPLIWLSIRRVVFSSGMIYVIKRRKKTHIRHYGEKNIRGPICLFLLALTILTLNSCGDGGGGTNSTQEEGSGTATLSWEAPTTNVDGTQLDALAGFKIYYGTSSEDYTVVKDVGLTATPDAPAYVLNGLDSGTFYYFAVTAYDTSGNESGFSGEVSKLTD